MGVIFFVDETEPVDIPQYAVPAEYRVLRKLKGKNKKVCSTQDRDDIQGPMKRQEGSSNKPKDIVPTVYEFPGLSAKQDNKSQEDIDTGYHQDTSQMAATNKILNDGVQKSNEISSSSGAPIPLLGDSQTGINRSNVNVLEGFAVAVYYVNPDGSFDILKTSHYPTGDRCVTSDHNCSIIDYASINFRDSRLGASEYVAPQQQSETMGDSNSF